MDDYKQRIELYRKEINERLSSLIRTSSPLLIYEAGRYVLESGGKRVRPLLTLFACESVGGHWKRALPAAIAVETLHNFTLVHDDIMDASDSRRGRPTVHKKWDDSIAILAGDALVAIAYKSLLETDSEQISQLAELFTEGLLDVCEGQSFDIEFEREKSITVNDYLHMIEKKTGALLRTAAALGGVVGNGSRKQVEALKRFGAYVGLAFQLQDDLLNIKADKKRIGKPMYNDIYSGKRTFLLLYAREKAGTRDCKTLEKVFRGKISSKVIVQEVINIFERTAAIDRAYSTAKEYTLKAQRELQKLPSTKGLQRLERFAQTLLHRSY